MKRVLFLAGILIAQSCWAYDDARVALNLRDDYADCVVYYQYAVQTFKNAHNDEQVKAFEKTDKAALAIYLGLMAGETDLKIKANLDLHMMIFKEIQNEQGDDGIIVKYSNFCKMMMQNPQPRIDYWKNKQ